MTRDSQRARVYAAEGFVRTMFDRAAERGNPVAEFFGTQLTLPPEARFGSVESVQRYVDDVVAHPAVAQRWTIPPLRVRARRGATAAHYERGADTAVIAVPDDRSGWALRELVVLHEIAHHIAACTAAADGPPHGPAFVEVNCALVGAVMGAEAAHVLRVVYAREGVR